MFRRRKLRKLTQEESNHIYISYPSLRPNLYYGCCSCGWIQTDPDVAAFAEQAWEQHHIDVTTPGRWGYQDIL